ncbi:phage repressor protein/antirepressor Ant, partial [bacterium 1XD42-1]
MNEIINIQGIECYEKDGTAYLKLDTVARGLGFTRIADSGNEVVRWERVEKYLSEIGAVPTCGDADFIPENVFYRLAMKAKNETAERFQAFIADEVIPSIRKHGAYMTPPTIESLLDNPDMLIQLATTLKEERLKRKTLETEN